MEALVDTGFDGGLTVPQELIPDRAVPRGSAVCNLADGSSFIAKRYGGFISIGALPPDPAVIIALPQGVLLGRAVTNNYRLIFDHGRQVILEP